MNMAFSSRYSMGAFSFTLRITVFSGPRVRALDVHASGVGCMTIGVFAFSFMLLSGRRPNNGSAS
jgi:hypothetical protein